MNGSYKSSLQINSPPFIQPEMFPTGIRNQIPTPTMGQLMGDDVDIFSIATDNRWCGKREDLEVLRVNIVRLYDYSAKGAEEWCK